MSTPYTWFTPSNQKWIGTPAVFADCIYVVCDALLRYMHFVVGCALFLYPYTVTWLTASDDMMRQVLSHQRIGLERMYKTEVLPIMMRVSQGGEILDKENAMAREVTRQMKVWGNDAVRYKIFMDTFFQAFDLRRKQH
jgi:hypothetical protein